MASTGEILATDWQLWMCNQETGTDFLYRWGPKEEMRQEMNRAADHGRDVWLISPKGRKYRPLQQWDSDSGELATENEKLYDERLKEAINSLNGDPERFRKILTDKDELLAKICRNAEARAKRKRVPVWSVIGEITGHGSGVSAAIYHLYNRTK